MKVVSFRDLIVWQKSMALCVEVYRATRDLPPEERFGLVSELRKTARSVPYNIAEGHRRRTTADYMRFLHIARGSNGELETQLILSGRLDYLDERRVRALLAHEDEIERMLSALLKALAMRRASSSSSSPDP